MGDISMPSSPDRLLAALSQLSPHTLVRVAALEESGGLSKRLEMDVQAGKLADALNDGLAVR